MSDVREKVITEPAVAPPTRWRNWYMANGHVNVTWTNGNVLSVGPGDTFFAWDLWPSRDVAEQKAHDDAPLRTCPSLEYLGAFQEGETPSQTS